MLTQRPRRLRNTATLRQMVAETTLSAHHLVQPYFVILGKQCQEPVNSMPGVFRLSVDLVVEEAQRAWACGIRSFLLFGLPLHKDEQGTGAWDDQGPVAQALRALRIALPQAVLIADVCLCEYTSHGHCGIVHQGEILNDTTLPLLTKAAVCYAQAGADIVAPSDMMDGRVAAIRAGLDQAGYTQTLILSYSVKYASAYYGPFRDAAQSAPQFGDRRSYQMDPANALEALKEAQEDELEGADMLMVKPGLAYLDILYRVSSATNLPVVAYSVSGEYSLIKSAALQGMVDERRIVLETLIAYRRAGARLIITYHAVEAAQWINQENP